MRVYTALCDRETRDVLIAQRRVSSQFWDGKTLPGKLLLREANQFCLPSSETAKDGGFDIDAGKRGFFRQTGHVVPDTQFVFQHTHHGTPEGWLLATFVVKNLRALADSINQGLAAQSSNHTAPNNENIRDWELAKVVIIAPAQLPEFLASAKKLDASESGLVYPVDEGIYDPILRYRQIVSALRRQLGR